MSGGSGMPSRQMTATITVPVTTRIVSVDHVAQSITVEVRCGRHSSLHTYTVTESQ